VPVGAQRRCSARLVREPARRSARV
jgi:hypothetical protein